MLNKLGQAYQQKFFRTEQLSPPLKRFQVYPQTLDEVDQENEIFLDFKTAQEEQYGGWFSTGMFGILTTAVFAAVILPFNEHLNALEKLQDFLLGVLILLTIIGIPSIIEILKPLPAPWRFNRRTREVYALDSHRPAPTPRRRRTRHDPDDRTRSRCRDSTPRRPTIPISAKPSRKSARGYYPVFLAP